MLFWRPLTPETLLFLSAAFSEAIPSSSTGNELSLGYESAPDCPASIAFTPILNLTNGFSNPLAFKSANLKGCWPIKKGVWHMSFNAKGFTILSLHFRAWSLAPKAPT
jgi:hypothetical protein